MKRLSAGKAVWLGAAAMLLAGLGSPSLAQDANFPTKSIRIIVGGTAGTTLDALARLIAEPLQKSLGQPVVVENHPGAGGALAYEMVAKAAPDGYTLQVADLASVGIGPATRKNSGYKASDFVPVSALSRQNFYLFAGPSLSTFKDFVDAAKAKPGVLKYGTPGIGGVHHLLFEQLSKELGIKLVHVPYRGGTQYMPALYNGEIDVALAGIAVSGVQDALKAGRAKVLAVTGAERDFQNKDYPTMPEVGLPQLAYTHSLVAYAPAKTPPAIVAKLAAEMNNAMKSEAIGKFLANLNNQPVGISGDALNREFTAVVARYTKVVEESGIKLD